MRQGYHMQVKDSALEKLQSTSPETFELLPDLADKFYRRLTQCETVNLSRLFNRTARQPGDTFGSVFRLAYAQFMLATRTMCSDAGAMMFYSYYPDQLDALYKRRTGADAATRTSRLQRENDSLRLAYLGMMDICGHSYASLGLDDSERQSLILHDPARLHILKQFPGIKAPS